MVNFVNIQNFLSFLLQLTDYWHKVYQLFRPFSRILAKQPCGGLKIFRRFLSAFAAEQVAFFVLVPTARNDNMVRGAKCPPLSDQRDRAATGPPYIFSSLLLLSSPQPFFRLDPTPARTKPFDPH